MSYQNQDFVILLRFWIMQNTDSSDIPVLDPQPCLQCPKNNQNLRTKTEPDLVGADVTVYNICQVSVPEIKYLCKQNQIYTVASAPALTGYRFLGGELDYFWDIVASNNVEICCGLRAWIPKNWSIYVDSFFMGTL